MNAVSKTSRMTCFHSVNKHSALPCSPPPNVTNATFQQKGEFVTDMEVYYECAIGYAPNGTSSIHCVNGSTWSEPLPVCIGEATSRIYFQFVSKFVIA